MLRKIWRDERGQDMMEYALVGAFVAAAAMAISPAVYAVAIYLGRSIHVLDMALQTTATR